MKAKREDIYSAKECQGHKSFAILVLYAWWNTHTMTVLHQGLYHFTVFFLA